MPSIYSPNLRVELIGTGEQSGTWGSTTNTNLGTILESAISGYQSIVVTSISQYLTALNGTEDQSRNMVIELSQYSSVSDNFTICIPPAEKYYVIKNSTTYTATIAATASPNTTTPLTGGTTVDVPAGKTMILFCDTSNVSEALTYVNNLTAGSLTLTTRLPETSGGVPTQTGYGSCFLTTDGTNAFWSGTGIKTVAVSTTGSNISLSSTTASPLDGITLTNDMRVLVKDQTSSSENGVWVVNTSGAWSRSLDANTASELAGSIVNVQSGTANGGTQWATTFKSTDTVGTTAMSWSAVVPLPSQTNNTSKVLTTNGTTALWASPGAKTVYLATTANLTTLSGLATTIDGVLVNSAGVRILVKNQTTTADNGIYISASGSWTRANDASTATDIAGSIVNIQTGTTNGGTQYATTFKASDTVGVSTMTWNPIVTGTITSGVTTFSAGTTGFTPSTATSGVVTLAGTLAVANGGTGQTTASAAINALLPTQTSNSGKYLTTNGSAASWATVASGTGTVTSVATGTGLTGGPITTSGTISVATGGITDTQLASNAVTTAKIAASAVTAAKIDNMILTSGGANASNGNQTLPGGYVMQWGNFTPPGSSATLTFPTAFPNYCFNVVLTTGKSGTGGVASSHAIASAPTKTSVALNTNAGEVCYWFAVGA